MITWKKKNAHALERNNDLKKFVQLMDEWMKSALYIHKLINELFKFKIYKLKHPPLRRPTCENNFYSFN